MEKKHFCPCDDHSCVLNPVNHEKGCSPCIEDSLKTKEIPRCFFIAAGGSLDGVTDWSFEAFAKYVIEHL